MDFQKARDWADFLLKGLSIIAILAGGGWAIYQYKITETAAANIQLTVAMEYQNYGDDSRLLLIHAKPKNIGKVLVRFGASGFVVTVRSVPEKLKQGILDIESLPVLYSVDLLKRFPTGYELEPGVEYDELFAVVVPKHSTYAAKAVLDLGAGDEVDHTAVVRVE